MRYSDKIKTLLIITVFIASFLILLFLNFFVGIVVLLLIGISVFRTYLLKLIRYIFVSVIYNFALKPILRLKLPHQLKVGIFFIIGLLIVLAVLEFIGGQPFLGKKEIRVPLQYSVQINYLPQSNLWLLKENIRVSEKTANEIKVIVENNKNLTLLSDFLSQGGWNQLKTAEKSDIYYRERKQKASIHPYRLETTNTIPVPRYADHIYEFEFDLSSEAVISAPNKLIVSTFPLPSSRYDLLINDREQLKIPLNALNDEAQPNIRIKVLNPLLQNQILRKYVAKPIWWAIKWFILLIVGTIALIIGNQVLKPVLQPLIQRISVHFNIPFTPEDEKDKKSGKAKKR